MPSNLEYPDVLEQAWLKIAMETTGRSTAVDAVNALGPEAGAISNAFTTGRDPTFAGYATRSRALAAYGLYFFPRAYARVRCVLRECRHVLQPEPGTSLRILDLGAGTGAAGFAAAHEMSGVHLQLTLVDQASKGLITARRIFDEGRTLWPRAKLITEESDARFYEPEKEFDIIISSFAVNEWMEEDKDDAALEDWASRLIKKLKPAGLLILLEPSQHESIDRILRLRNRLAAGAKGRIVAPCPHHEACPMQAEKRGWCHEVRKWQAPESMHWINRSLERDIHLLKFSFLVIQRGKPAAESWMRIVSPVRKEKGKFVFHGCGSDGKLHTCEWMNRKLKKEEIIRSEQLERGDRVLWNPDKVLGDGRTERSEEPPGAAFENA